MNRYPITALLLSCWLFGAPQSGAQPADVNYDESKIPPYTLPDPLKMQSGAAVTDAAMWRSKRRPEVLALFQKNVYGKAPGRPAELKFLAPEAATDALGGKATRKQVTILLAGKPNGPKMELLLYLPNGERKPVPVFLGLNFHGNHSIHTDPGIHLNRTWMRPDPKSGIVNNRATEQSRGVESSRWPVERILARGFALATVYYGDIEPDSPDQFAASVRAAFLKPGQTKPGPDEWGAISAWAWGLSRALDYLETDKDVDARRVAVMGHSRLGKTALWAGASDERFALVISNNSGCGGASLARRRFGETVARINKSFPHWFCDNYKQYGERVDDLPVDQHMLIALAAPRPVYVASAQEDRWADPRGEFLSAKGADGVYKLLGTDGLAAEKWPACEHPVKSTIGYHIRQGKHNVTDYDWEQYMNCFRRNVPGNFVRGEWVLSAEFEGRNPGQDFSGKLQFDTGFRGGHALLVERSADGPAGSASVSCRLPAEQLRGCTLRFSTMVRAEKISAKPKPWNGVKFMAPIVSASGRSWPAASLDAGTFGWQPAGFTVRVPDDAQQMSLVLGLEAVTGKAWFDDVRVVVYKLPRVSVAAAAPSGPVYKGHDLPRLRGAMISSQVDAESLRVLGQQWKANVVRWQLIRTRYKGDPLDLDAYDQWLQSALEKLDAGLPLCEKYGLRVVVDLHSPPGGQATSGGYAGSDHGLFTSRACQEKFVANWAAMAKRYKNCKAIWGYDLANEPVEGLVGEGLADWPELALRAARAIRAVDPVRTIIVEPAEGGGPHGLLDFEPLPVANVVYSVHMYIPGQFTHQGVHGEWKPCVYPGVIDGKSWGKAQLEAALKPAIDFQKQYNAHLYIGEFSAIRWAPEGSAQRYLKDLIDIFEAHGWDWSYHAFREWDGWSVEHGPDKNDRKPATAPTDRQRLLQDWFAKNRRP